MANPVATLTSKGQLTMPASIRKALGLEAGDRLEVTALSSSEVRLRKRGGSAAAIGGLLSHLKPDPAYPTDADAVAAEALARSARRKSSK